MNAKNKKSLTDEQLVRMLQQGDRCAMGELYARYYTLVFNKCLSFVKNTNDAGDLAQDVMLKVMEKINSFKGESKFSTWLYAITFNYSTDQVRKVKDKYFASLDAQFDLVDHSEVELEEATKMDMRDGHAEKALTAISRKDQQLLIMKYQFNKSIQDLQTMYDLSASAIKMRLLRARAKASDSYYRMITNHAA